MVAHMHAEAMTADQAPLSRKMKRRAACHSEIRPRREQANESMCECSMRRVEVSRATPLL